jgi:hypothetical protein
MRADTMSARFVTICLSIPLVAVGLVSPAHAQHKHPWAGGGVQDIGWSYYGLGGGPYISYHPWTFPTHRKHSHHLPVPTYGPPPVPLDVRGHQWTPPAHPGFGYGWFGYRSPSPRPKPPTVGMYPPVQLVAPGADVYLPMK